MKITHFSVTVSDQHKALQWYTDHLGFQKVVEMPFSPTALWLTIGVPEQPGLEIVLEAESMAVDAEMAAEIRERVGKSTTVSLDVDDVRQLHNDLTAKGVTVLMPPTEYPWGTQILIADPDGNKVMISQRPEGGYNPGA